MRVVLLVFACGAISACSDLGLESDTTYRGEFSGPLIWTSTSGVSCVTTYAVTGKVEIDLTEQSIEQVIGVGTVEVTETPRSPSPAGCGPAPSRHWESTGQITGKILGFGFGHEYTASGVLAETIQTSFVASSVWGDEITARVYVNHSGAGIIEGVSNTIGGFGTFDVTLKR